MSKFLLVALLLAVCLCMVSCAAINGRAPAPVPTVLLDAKTIIAKITAEYEKLGGSSVHYPEEAATLIDPNNFHIVG